MVGWMERRDLVARRPALAPGWGDSSVVGDVAPRTARVGIVTKSGQTNEAAVAHGRFLAWWPDADPVTSIIAYDASGTVIATIPGGSRPEPDPS